MRRAVNEMSADEVHRGQGFKVGDFGVGGRRYVVRSTRSRGAKSQDLNTIRGCGSCFAIIMFFFIERWLNLTLGTFGEASLAISYGDNAKLDMSNEDKIVHATSARDYPPYLTGPPPSDDAFGISARDGDAVLKRVTEYCQWMEIQHSKQVKVGKEPDYCSSSYSSDESCDRVSCSSLSYGSCSRSNCCRWTEGNDIYETEYWYTYHKGWRSHRINSLLFDSPAAYFNPQRDPFPSQEIWANGDVDITGKDREGEILVQPKDIQKVLENTGTLFLTKEDSEKRYHALSEGFTELSYEHYYSRVPEDGLNNPVVRAAASYLIDGVVDVNALSKGSGLEALLKRSGLNWITEGTCNAGDIRVHFESSRLPREITVLGKQSLKRIVPNKYKNGEESLMISSVAESVDSLLERIKEEAESNAWWRRLGTFIVYLLIATFCSDDPILGAVLGCFISFTTWSLLWFVYYPLTNWTYIVLGLSIILGGIYFGPEIGAMLPSGSGSGSRPEKKID
jgi:hypothetical protein